ncbi:MULTISPECIES: lipid-transfer protein [unclassified Streptomyces]|uniref:lipid-transfer protein n=1 Tax=unclassified Streptomyces TaxID=2593676 RepID=UPI000DB975EB|nr:MULTISPECIES: lipid-transfer protein [unclassified Streptomyces]MYU04565.1 lipid-transfer protein [Streptomyces sp. SID8366]MYU66447.1 lipid-transfer protein [Streptomyces sp. SID69]RAJ58454.1 acetyl-CoA acetyltransferase [Streptomyces sp. PsTaAH-130]
MGGTGLKDATAIVGIGQTAFARHLPEDEKTLACRAVLAALDDAGITPGEVDAVASYTMEETDEVELAKAVGFGDLTYFGKVGYGGGGSCATVAHLATAVAAGQATVGVAWRSRKRGSGPRPWTGTTGQLPTPAQWTRPFGLLRPADETAMLARRYMHEYGATRDHLFNVALACRNRANQNPAAVMYDRPLTREMYMTSRWISEPLCLFDNCLETDGAAACVVVGRERARDCRRRPVYVHAAAQGLPAQHHGMVNYWNDDPLTGPAWTTARQLWKHADLTPDDVDVAQIYDGFSVLVPLSLEGYGFCGRGEGGAFTEQGALEIGGRLPLNTGGGGLSEGYVHGFNLVTEGVRQLRGTSTAQVPGAATCLVTAGESVPTSALLLRS